jgi:hypothetical protein
MKDMPFRAEVYAGGRTDAALLDNLLQVEDIDTIVTADKRVARIGPLSGASVFVLDPAQVERARDIVERYRRREPLKDPKSYRSWRCRACNELVEGQFEVCWKCSASRPAGHASRNELPALKSIADPGALEPAKPFRDVPVPAKRLQDLIVMVVFLLAALLLMFASSARRRAGPLPPQPSPFVGQR